jgi:TetR/AcrR family transcriptional regulator, tetracycline repressor protein
LDFSPVTPSSPGKRQTWPFILSSAVMLVSTQAGIEIPEPDERAENQRRKRIALASLPPDRDPHIIASAAHLTDCASPDAYFRRGSDAIIAGVRAQAPSSHLLHR